MRTTNETNSILFEALTDLKSEINGGIYKKKRPDNSEKEDIVINTTFLTTTLPQTGLSNINIFVPDQKVKIKGTEQKQPNDERLEYLVSLVYDKLKASKIEGLLLWPTHETPIEEPGVGQHYINLRIEWNIHK